MAGLDSEDQDSASSIWSYRRRCDYRFRIITLSFDNGDRCY
jgi:hypothetical protein